MCYWQFIGDTKRHETNVFAFDSALGVIFAESSQNHFLHFQASGAWEGINVKSTLVQALRLCTVRTARTMSRGIALLFLNHGTRREWGASHTLRPLFAPGKDPVPVVQEAGWAPGAVWTGAENIALTGIDLRTVQPVASRYTDWATGPNEKGLLYTNLYIIDHVTGQCLGSRFIRWFLRNCFKSLKWITVGGGLERNVIEIGR
jgi:hypothetical protein